MNSSTKTRTEFLLWIVFLLLIALYFTGCAQGPEKAKGLTCSSIAGQYLQQYSSNTLTLNADCTLSESYCGYSATFTAPTGNPGLTNVVVYGTNGTPGCMSSQPNIHSCTVNWDNVLLAINCDATSTVYYDKQ